jgi:excisionase family DNA binding protein
VTEKLPLRLTETADVLGLSVHTVQSLIAAGRMPSVHYGRRVVVPRKALAESLDQLAEVSLARPST